MSYFREAEGTNNKNKNEYVVLLQFGTIDGNVVSGNQKMVTYPPP